MLSQGQIYSDLILIYVKGILASMRYIIALTRAGPLVVSHVSVSRMDERLVIVVSRRGLLRAREVFSMDLNASFGFLMNMARRADPYLLWQVLLASFIVSLVATWCFL